MIGQIRQLKQADEDPIYDIALAAIVPVWSKKEYGFFLNQPGSFCWGIEDSRGLASFVLALRTGNEVDIVTIATRTDVQRKGLGCELLKSVLEKPGIEGAFLEVDPTNEPAVKLYLKMGFSVMGLRKKYYQGKKDAWVMKWKRP
ncbi:N-acetyltransferase [bacterium]|nr:N-acetyltransferase [bacterium]